MGNRSRKAQSEGIAGGGQISARAGVAAALTVLLALASGCGSVEPGPLIGEVVVDVPADAVKVLALDNRFIPEVVTVPAGSRVVLVNSGRNEHNIIPARGGSGWGIDEQSFLRGTTYEVAFAAVGTAYYFCDIHGDEFSGMIGQIVVEPAS